MAKLLYKEQGASRGINAYNSQIQALTWELEKAPCKGNLFIKSPGTICQGKCPGSTHLLPVPPEERGAQNFSKSLSYIAACTVLRRLLA